MVFHQLRDVCQAELATLATFATVITVATVATAPVPEGALLSTSGVFTPEVVQCSTVQPLGCFLDVTLKSSKFRQKTLNQPTVNMNLSIV